LDAALLLADGSVAAGGLVVVEAVSVAESAQELALLLHLAFSPAAS